MARVLTRPAPSVREVRDRVPIQTDAVLQKALAPLAADRFAAVDRFAEALRASVSGGRAEATGRDWIPAAAPRRPWGSTRLTAAFESEL